MTYVEELNLINRLISTDLLAALLIDHGIAKTDVLNSASGVASASRSQMLFYLVE